MITQNDLIEMTIINNNIKLNVITHYIETTERIIIHIHGIRSHFQSIYSCMNEIHERFNTLVPYNIKSYALELRGHGKSEGIRCHINNFDEFISDLHALITHIKTVYPLTPIYLLGESMGGAIAIKYTIVYPYVASGVILLAPMFGMPKESDIPFYKAYPLMALSYVLPTWGIIPYKPEKSCCYVKYLNAKRINKYQYNAPLRLGIGRECFITMRWLNEHKQKFITPFVAFHSKIDPVTDINHTRLFVDGCGATNKKLIELADGNHTLFVPLDCDDVQPHIIMMEIIDWIISVYSNK